jgi:hypothetical protein
MITEMQLDLIVVNLYGRMKVLNISPHVPLLNQDDLISKVENLCINAAPVALITVHINYDLNPYYPPKNGSLVASKLFLLKARPITRTQWFRFNGVELEDGLEDDQSDSAGNCPNTESGVVGLG